MLHLHDVNYQRQHKNVLHGMHGILQGGEFVSIVGPNGSGKTTLLRLLAGQLQPSSGTILLHGKPLAQYSLSALAARRAYLHQSQSLQLNFKVEEVVAMGRYSAPTSPQQNNRVVKECLRVCALEDVAHRNIRTLSGGEQQRVHYARVLAQLWDVDSGILLLDEPIASMDLQYQHLSLAIAKAFAAKGFLVVAIVHDLNLAAQYSDRVLMLKNGRQWWVGSPQEVLKAEHIYQVFGVHSKVAIDHDSWTTNVQPKAMHLAMEDFNSRYAAALDQPIPTAID